MRECRLPAEVGDAGHPGDPQGVLSIPRTQRSCWRIWALCLNFVVFAGKVGNGRAPGHGVGAVGKDPEGSSDPPIPPLPSPLPHLPPRRLLTEEFCRDESALEASRVS